MTPYVWRPVGELLVERGLIDTYDLEVALREQKLSGQLLGELLVAKRLVSPIDMAAVLAAHHGIHLDASAAPADTQPAEVRPRGRQGWKPLGRILVERGVLTESGLQRALLTQRRSARSLGEILVQRRYVTPAQLADALALQNGLTVHPAVLDAARALEPDARPEERYELRVPGAEGVAPLFVSDSYLDATDFAFELLHATDPDALEIVRVGDEDEAVWTYSRDASDAFRAETAHQRGRFTPLVFLAEAGDAPDGAPSAA